MPDFLQRLRTGVTTATPAETRDLAARLALLLPPDATIALHGDLGVGKTTFVQGLARGLGIDSAITSPTYTIFTIHRPSAAAATVHGSQFTVHSSQAADANNTVARERQTVNRELGTVNCGGSDAALVHLDAYRLETPAQYESLMLDDFLVSPCILAIEWPEKIAPYIPKTAWHITLSIESPRRHLVRLG